jgi:guanine nucleotide-binding protein subunit alpha, other
MRLIHAQHFSPAEIESFRQLVFRNLTDGMSLILDAMRELAAVTAARRATTSAPAAAATAADASRSGSASTPGSQSRSYDALLEPQNIQYARMLDTVPEICDGEPFPPEYEHALRELWQDAGVARVRSRGNEVALPEK